MNTTAAALDLLPSLLVELACASCGDVAEHPVHEVIFEGDAARRPPGWDGFFTNRTITCGQCAAVHAYTLTDGARASLVARLERGDPLVQAGEVRLSDGTLLARPSDGLRHLRAAAEAAPHDGRLWRQLGNFQERIGELDDAVDSWARAAEDPLEILAVGSLERVAHLTGRGADAEGALTRLPHCHRDAETLPACLTTLVAVLAVDPEPRTLHVVSPHPQLEAGRPIVDVAGARLRHVKDWPKLIVFLLTEEIVSLTFSDEAPEHADSRFERWLSDPDARGRFPREGWEVPAARPAGMVAAQRRKERKRKRQAKKAARKKRRQR